MGEQHNWNKFYFKNVCPKKIGSTNNTINSFSKKQIYKTNFGNARERRRKLKTVSEKSFLEILRKNGAFLPKREHTECVVQQLRPPYLLRGTSTVVSGALHLTAPVDFLCLERPFPYGARCFFWLGLSVSDGALFCSCDWQDYAPDADTLSNPIGHTLLVTPSPENIRKEKS